MADKQTILIVDDVEINRDILREVLKDDYKILEAADGEQALEVLHENHALIKCVLLDVVMPKLDGFGVLDGMRKNLSLSTIPSIITSSANEGEFGLRAIELGASEFVSKPIDPRVVRMRVANAIARGESDAMRAQNQYLTLQKEEEERYRVVLESTGTLVFEYNPKTKKFKYDRLVSSYLPGEYKESSSLWEIMLSAKVAPTTTILAMQQLVSAAVYTPSILTDSMNVRLRTLDGQQRWFRFLVVKRMNDMANPEKIITTLNDIDEEVKAIDSLTYLAKYDSLTGIHNKNSFLMDTKALIEKNPNVSYAVIRFDINKFKVVNDIFGHEQGNRLLSHIAESLRVFAENRGTFARIEADNFALCLPNTERLVDDILTKLDPSITSYSIPFEIFVSYGVYLVTDPSLSVEAMLDRATIAQRDIKGNFITRLAFYDERARDDMLEEQRILSDMSIALEQEQFVIWLQPKCRLDSGEIVGAEALVRWNHPERGILMPGVFIPILERNGLIMRLDEYVWEHVFMVVRKWIDQGLQPTPVTVSTNVSRLNIYNPELCNTLVALAEKYNVPTSLVHLEITESAYADNPTLLRDVMAQLRASGFIMEMDDFGSGYSSLNMLKEIPVDVLKIDMRFLHGDDNSGRGGSILASVVRMARWLKLPVVAEGVETPEQAVFLRNIGCTSAQGYYFYKPMPVSEFEKILETYTPETPTTNDEVLDGFDAEQLWSIDNNANAIISNLVGGIGIFERSAAGIETIRVNDEYLSVVHATGEQYYEHPNIKSRVHPDDVAELERSVTRAAQTHERVDCEFRMLCPDGVTRWMLARIKHIASERERDLFYSSLNDVTEIKNQQRLLEKQSLSLSRGKNELEELLHTVQCGIARYSIESEPKILFCNRYALAMSGLASDKELMGKPVASFIHPDDRDYFSWVLNTCRATGKPEVYNVRLRNAKGETVHIRGNINLIETGEGETVIQDAFVDVSVNEADEYAHRDDVYKHASVVKLKFDEKAGEAVIPDWLRARLRANIGPEAYEKCVAFLCEPATYKKAKKGTPAELEFAKSRGGTPMLMSVVYKDTDEYVCYIRSANIETNT